MKRSPGIIALSLGCTLIIAAAALTYPKTFSIGSLRFQLFELADTAGLFLTVFGVALLFRKRAR